MDKQKKNKTSKKTLFFILVSLIYLTVTLINPNIAKEALFNTAIMLLKILPILLIVFVIMIFINIYIGSEKIKRHLGENSGIKGWFYSIISGILISGPPYILFPLLEEFKKKGMRNSLLATFLYNRNVKIPFIPIMVYYFGFKFTIIISIYIIIFSVLNGKTVELFTKGNRKQFKSNLR